MNTPYQTMTFYPDIYPELTKVIEALDPDEDWCIAGGAIRRYIEKLWSLNKGDTADIDIFILNNAPFSSQHIVQKLGVAPKQTAVNGLVKYKGEISIDVIKNKNYRSPYEVVEDFDFVCCMCFYYKGKIYTSQQAFADIRDMKLNLNNYKRPYSTLNRMMRYARKGYQLSEEFAENLIDALQIDTDVSYYYSISNPESFNYNDYSEEENGNQGTLSL